jgi:ABC-type nitrate/sulfonate/bicarbonate transport system permease component
MTVRWFRARAIQLGVIIVLLALWWYAYDVLHVSPLILASPSEVARSLPATVSSHTFLSSLALTVEQVLLAFAFSVVVGLAVGIGAGLSAHWTQVVRPLVVWAQTVPIILLYPICILFFGLGSTSKIVFAGIYGTFPIVLNTFAGMDSEARRYRPLATVYGAGALATAWKLALPAARPFIMNGARLALALNIIGVLAGQILGSTGGLGYQIVAAEGTFSTVDLYAYVILTIVLVVAANAVVSRGEGSAEAHSGI